MKMQSIMFASAVFCTSLVLMSTHTPATAQETAAMPEIFEIVVTAPRVTVEESRRPTAGRAEVSMSYAVGYADLDLTRAENRTELEERVQEAAVEICEFLSERYGGTRSSTAACTRQALRDAMIQVEQAIAAASS